MGHGRSTRSGLGGGRTGLRCSQDSASRGGICLDTAEMAGSRIPRPRTPSISPQSCPHPVSPCVAPVQGGSWLASSLVRPAPAGPSTPSPGPPATPTQWRRIAGASHRDDHVVIRPDLGRTCRTPRTQATHRLSFAGLLTVRGKRKFLAVFVVDVENQQADALGSRSISCTGNRVRCTRPHDAVTKPSAATFPAGTDGVMVSQVPSAVPAMPPVVPSMAAPGPRPPPGPRPRLPLSPPPAAAKAPKTRPVAAVVPMEDSRTRSVACWSVWRSPFPRKGRHRRPARRRFLTHGCRHCGDEVEGVILSPPTCPSQDRVRLARRVDRIDGDVQAPPTGNEGRVGCGIPERGHAGLQRGAAGPRLRDRESGGREAPAASGLPHHLQQHEHL